MEATSHKRLILEYLEEGNEITPKDAWIKFGCYRLGARIYDLRQEGWEIVDINKGTKDRFARYILKKEVSE